MQISKDTVVTLNYRVTDDDQQTVDEGARPLMYLHGGYDDIFAKLEVALDGKQLGDKVSVVLEPEDAFGEYDADMVQLEELGNLPEGVEVGLQLEGAAEDGSSSRLYTVVEIEGTQVVLDANHPLAGMRLTFDCTVADVRPATADEVSQRHASH